MKTSILTLTLALTLAACGSDNTAPSNPEPTPPGEGGIEGSPILPSQPIPPVDGESGMLPIQPILPSQPIESEFGVNIYVCSTLYEPAADVGKHKMLVAIDEHPSDEFYLNAASHSCQQHPTVKEVGDTVFVETELKEQSGDNWIGRDFCSFDLVLQNPAQGKNLFLIYDASRELGTCWFSYYTQDPE